MTAHAPVIVSDITAEQDPPGAAKLRRAQRIALGDDDTAVMPRGVLVVEVRERAEGGRPGRVLSMQVFRDYGDLEVFVERTEAADGPDGDD